MWLFEVALLSFSIKNLFFNPLDGILINFNIIVWLGSRHSSSVNCITNLNLVGDVAPSGTKRVLPRLIQADFKTLFVG